MCFCDLCNQDAISHKLLQTNNEVLSDVTMQLSVQSFHFRAIPFIRRKKKKHIWNNVCKLNDKVS